ncbi:ankyrin repeat-containing domain protein [Gilbertella persicaria]|uniref:ankyrin repeat-containing domain protein n=1 Tax=Gilbertella persicaria TaxID=101096 RepID=UPI0022201AE3|nr:ankyrin repeat-containing domain protein [Gilbertella persicaria]KAI8050661.1 ankyrin repeat-containing domain protein [Gilbertella persicaria]
MYTEKPTTLHHRHSFFDLQRAAIIRDTPSVRLRKAAQEGNIAAVKRLLKKVSNIQNPDPETGYTTLMYAARYGHVDLVELLLELGHEEEVISMDKEGITVLMLAAMYNHEEIFFLYVSRYPECIHAISKHGWTALFYAAQNGNANLVSYLLSISADFDHIDNDGNSALHHASAWGHITVMDLLVSEGCNVNLENNEHSTAYDYAYSTLVQERLKEMSLIPFNDDSTLSVSSLQRQQSLVNGPYSSSYSSTSGYLGLNSMALSRGPSYGNTGHESPIPRASTSSSSLVIPSSASGTNTGMLTSSRGSFQQQSGSPSSLSELERRRASSFGDTKPKGYRPI